MGFGVAVDIKKEEEIFRDWHVCFHCTSVEAIRSIVTHRTMALPGDILLDGTELRIPTHHTQGQRYVFTSPCLQYCAHYGTERVWENKTVRLALQLRVQPGSYTVQKDTLRHKTSYHSRFPPNEIEWKTNIRGAVVVTRILMKIVE
ncbi:hypothetical protein DFJ77DRAFT_339296 [Powellomyces hirtus]|nr:hypothetical protein DFJ77DRAFT_339296 [Powellomyces hirtus]